MIRLNVNRKKERTKERRKEVTPCQLQVLCPLYVNECERVWDSGGQGSLLGASIDSRGLDGGLRQDASRAIYSLLDPEWWTPCVGKVYKRVQLFSSPTVYSTPSHLSPEQQRLND